MRIVKIVALENGAHRNQTYTGLHGYIPDGWAVVPADLETPNFPFGEVTVDETWNPPVVTAWSPLPMPEPEPVPEPEPTADELMDILLGVSE